MQSESLKVYGLRDDELGYSEIRMDLFHEFYVRVYKLFSRVLLPSQISCR